MKIDKQDILARGFELTTLYPIKTAHRLLGDRIWSPLGFVTRAGAFIAGRATRRFLADPSDPPLEQAIRLIDGFEESVGIFGEWERISGNEAVKRITSCRFAPKWGKAGKFCTILGEIMGDEAVTALLPENKVIYEIRSALSQGAPRCEYYLRVD